MRSELVKVPIQMAASDDWLARPQQRKITSMANRGAVELAINELAAVADRGQLTASLRAILCRYTMPSKSHEYLAQLPFASAVTSNYDALLERSGLDRSGEDWSENPVDLDSQRGPLAAEIPFLLKLYGDLAGDRPALLSHAEFEAKAKAGTFTPVFQRVFAARSLLFVGCSLEGLLADLHALGLDGMAGRKHYALAGVSSPAWKKQAADLKQRFGVQVLACTAESIATALPEFLELLAGKVQEQADARPHVIDAKTRSTGRPRATRNARSCPTVFTRCRDCAPPPIKRRGDFMRLILAVFAVAALVGPQPASAFQARSKSIYCDDHPFEKECFDGVGIGLNGGAIKPWNTPVLTPKPKPAAAQPATAPPAAPRPATQPVAVSVPEADWRFADPQPALVGGINIASLSHSPLVHKLLEQIAAQLGQGPEILNKLSDSNITRISFSVSERHGEPAALVLVEGSLDEAAAASVQTGLVQAKMEMRRVDSNRMLLGSGPDLDAALSRMQSQRPLVRAGVLQEAQTLAASNDFWIAGSIPNLGPMKLPLPISALTLGLNLQKDVLMDLSVNTGSVKNAQDLLRQLQQSQKNDLAKIGASMSAGSSGSTVRVRFAMNGESVSRAMGDAISEGLGPQFATQFAGMLSKAGMPSAASSGTAPAPVHKNAVIYGLDDGPRELPLGPKP